MKSTITTVALSALTQSPLNVRETKKDDPAIAELAASILARGLIQPIAVHALAKPKNKFGVLAGERRWRAITLLKEQGAAFDFDAIPVNQLAGSDAELTEVSLAENFVRRGMKPPQIYAAFKAIKDRNPELSDREIGERFGLDPARTSRIMRLAFLHPKVFDAYEKGTLKDEQAFAFAATEDRVLQLQTFNAIMKALPHQRHPANIRSAMKVGDDQHKRMLTFVGLEHYQAAGGVFEPDLFAQEANAGRVMDPDLLQRLVGDRMDLERAKLAGLYGPALEFATAVPKDRYGYEDHDLRIRPPQTKPAGDDAQRIAAIDERLSEITQLFHANSETWFDETGNEKPDFAEGIEQLSIEAQRLKDEKRDIGERQPFKLPEGKVQAVLSVDRDGELQVAFYWAKGAKPKAGKAAKGGGPAPRTPDESQRLSWGLTKDNMQAMLLLRRDMIREQLYHTATSGSPIALDFLLYSQARAILRIDGKTWDGRPDRAGGATGIEMPASQDEGGSKPPASVRNVYGTLKAAPFYQGALQRLSRAPWVTAVDPAEGWSIFTAEGPETRILATVVAVAHGLQASTSYYGEGRTPRMIEELACCLELDHGAQTWAETVTYDDAFFTLIGHKQRCELLREWGLVEHAKTLKKPESAAMCARVVNACKKGDDIECARLGIEGDERGEIALWRPEWLDTRMVSPMSSRSTVPAPEPDEPQEGTCRICGCVEEQACVVDGAPCAWADDTRTLCDNPACVAAAAPGGEEVPEPEPEAEAA